MPLPLGRQHILLRMAWCALPSPAEGYSAMLLRGSYPHNWSRRLESNQLLRVPNPVDQPFFPRLDSFGFFSAPSPAGAPSMAHVWSPRTESNRIQRVTKPLHRQQCFRGLNLYPGSLWLRQKHNSCNDQLTAPGAWWASPRCLHRNPGYKLKIW